MLSLGNAVAGRKAIAVTDRQFVVLRLLWRHGPMTVREALAKLPEGERQPYTTVLALMQHMEKAGLLVHEKEGAAYRYRPAIAEREGTRRLLQDILDRFFGGSPHALVAGLVDAEQISAEELADLEAKLRSEAPPGDAPPASRKRKGK
jgi:predicted transcriptional regulator